MRHRRPVLNGVSGYDPPHYEPLKSGLSTHDPELLLAIASLGAFDVVVNAADDPGGALGRYVASVPGATVGSTDGTRTVYQIPATVRPEVRLGPVVPIVSAWANSQEGSLAVDGRMETEWNDGRSQQPGQWLIADLGQVREVAGVTHALGEYARDFPRLLAIDLSLDGSDVGAGLAGSDRRPGVPGRDGGADRGRDALCLRAAPGSLPAPSSARHGDSSLASGRTVGAWGSRQSVVGSRQSQSSVSVVSLGRQSRSSVSVVSLGRQSRSSVSVVSLGRQSRSSVSVVSLGRQSQSSVSVVSLGRHSQSSVAPAAIRRAFISPAHGFCTTA